MDDARRYRWVLAGCALCSIGVAALPSAAEQSSSETIVDRVVVIVGAAGQRGNEVEIVTAYELEVEARLILAERFHRVDAAAAQPLTERLLERVRDMLIEHLLIVSEATRLELVSLSDEEIGTVRRDLEQRLGGEGNLDLFRDAVDAPEDLIEAIIQRRALVESFVRQNIQPAARVSTADIDEAYREGEHPFGDRPLEEIRTFLEAYLTARRQTQRLRQWLDDARRRNRVRIIPL